MGTIVNLLWQIFMLMGILYCEWPKFKTYSTHLVTLAENTHLLQKTVQLNSCLNGLYSTKQVNVTPFMK